MTARIAKTALFAGLAAALLFTFSVNELVQAEKIDEKSRLKEMIKDKMNQQAQKDIEEKETDIKYTSQEYGIPYNLSFEENGKLIVGIDARKAVDFDKRYSADEIKSDLDTKMDLDVRYYIFERETALREGNALVAAVTDAGDDEGVATITLVRDNKIITTGHAYDNNQIIAAGTVHIACQDLRITHNPYSNPQIADAAYGIKINNPNCSNDYIDNSIHYNGRIYSVVDGTHSDIYKNRFVRIAGAFTGSSSGHILDADVSTKDLKGILLNQVVVNYSSQKGDSGAPVFAITGSSSAKILGQHVGKICKVDLNSNALNSDDLNSDENFVDWCHDSYGGGSLNVFTPWPSVMSNLGI